MIQKIKIWWAWVDLNYRPHAYQACALTRLSYRPAIPIRYNLILRKRNEDGEDPAMFVRKTDNIYSKNFKRK